MLSSAAVGRGGGGEPAGQQAQQAQQDVQGSQGGYHLLPWLCVHIAKAACSGECKNWSIRTITVLHVAIGLHFSSMMSSLEVNENEIGLTFGLVNLSTKYSCRV